MSVFPNPAADFVMLQGSGAEGNLVLTVRDLTGRLVHFQEFQNPVDWTYRLDLSDWASGMYLISTQDGAGNMHTERLLRD